jgi:hypothetical protein
MDYNKHTVSADRAVWDTAKKLIKEEWNMTMSKWIEIQLRALLNSRKYPINDVIQNAMLDFARADKSLSEKEREVISDVIKGKDKVKVKKKKP